jgi:7-carboxy-7-deazaguanine synthase
MKVNEIFVSIQGEGLYIGENHLFLRTSGCNLKCYYCDTDTLKYRDISPCDLVDRVLKIYDKFKFSKISLTGGEPLLQKDLKEFLIMFKQKSNISFMLETNATLTYELEKILPFIDFYSLDFKLDYHIDKYDFFKFYQLLDKKEKYIKIVYKNNEKDKLKKALEILKNIECPIFLQPISPFNKNDINLALYFLNKYSNKLNLRFLPQIHKIIGLK